MHLYFLMFGFEFQFLYRTTYYSLVKFEVCHYLMFELQVL